MFIKTKCLPGAKVGDNNGGKIFGVLSRGTTGSSLTNSYSA
jgi:hypothetical protein